jgi:hypothetical protein
MLASQKLTNCCVAAIGAFCLTSDIDAFVKSINMASDFYCIGGLFVCPQAEKNGPRRTRPNRTSTKRPAIFDKSSCQSGPSRLN